MLRRDALTSAHFSYKGSPAECRELCAGLLWMKSSSCSAVAVMQLPIAALTALCHVRLSRSCPMGPRRRRIVLQPRAAGQMRREGSRALPERGGSPARGRGRAWRGPVADGGGGCSNCGPCGGTGVAASTNAAAAGSTASSGVAGAPTGSGQGAAAAAAAPPPRGGASRTSSCGRREGQQLQPAADG